VEVEKPGRSTAQEVDEGRDEDEERVRDSSKWRAGHKGKKRRE